MVVKRSPIYRPILVPGFAILATLFGSISCSAEQLPPAALIAVKGVCPKVTDQIESAMGDLNGDKIPDAAILLGCKSQDDQEVMILYGQHGGSYKIALRSQVWPFNGRSEIALQIRNRTLIFSEHCAFNCNPESWSSTYKFTIRNDQLILVGEDYISTMLSGKDYEIVKTSGTSINYLTQKLIYWGKTDGKDYTETRNFFKLKVPLGFTDFNFEACRLRQSCMPISVSLPKQK